MGDDQTRSTCERQGDLGADAGNVVDGKAIGVKGGCTDDGHPQCSHQQRVNPLVLSVAKQERGAADEEYGQCKTLVRLLLDGHQYRYGDRQQGREHAMNNTHQ